MSSLVKSVAKKLCEENRNAKLDFRAVPIESGMGGCPWRVIVAAIVAVDAREGILSVVLNGLFARYPEPRAMAVANYLELCNLIRQVPMSHRKERSLRRVSERWIGEDWEQILDLPNITIRAIDAIEKFVPKSCQADFVGPG